MEDDAGREDVRPRVDGHAADLLGRHVAELALEDADLRRDLQHRLRDAEVEELHLAVIADADVRRRHVAVDDVERPPLLVGERVRELQPLAHARGDEAGVRHRDALVGLLAATEDLGEVLPADVLHRDEVVLVDAVDLDGAHDARVIEHHGELALAHEHVDEARLLGQLRPHALHRVERVRGAARAEGIDPAGLPLFRPVDLGHAAARDHAEEEVPPERGRIGGAPRVELHDVGLRLVHHRSEPRRAGARVSRRSLRC